MTNQLRRDTIEQNGKKIEEAKSEAETWKIVNNIIKQETRKDNQSGCK